MLFNRTKARRFRSSREAEQATAWFEQVAEHHADATAVAAAPGGHLPPRRGELYVRPGTPFTRPRPAAAPRRPQRVIAGIAPAPDAPTEQLPVVRAELAAVPAPVIGRLPMSRAPQGAATEQLPVLRAQRLPGRTFTFSVPAAPSYAERLAAVFDTAAEKFTQLSGWANNRAIDDDRVTHERFMNLRDRYADLLPPLRALAGAR